MHLQWKSCRRLHPLPRGSSLINILKRHASTKFTRQEKIDSLNLLSRGRLSQLDSRFDLFNENVTKVVDLGYSPGNWLKYAREALLVVHSIETKKIHQKCTLVGLDIVIGNHPEGTFTTQGNIMSKLAHQNVINLLRDHAYRKLAVQNGVLKDLDPMNEIENSSFDTELATLPLLFDHLSLQKDKTLDSILSLHDYQADVVLSDLSQPLLQDRGFFNNTISKPFIRSRTNPELRRNYDDPLKSSIDMADAAILLCCDALVKGGKLVLRLARVDLSDPELLLLEQRLKKMFTNVIKWAPDGPTESEEPKLLELFFIGENKKENIADKYYIFDIKR